MSTWRSSALSLLRSLVLRIGALAKLILPDPVSQRWATPAVCETLTSVPESGCFMMALPDALIHADERGKLLFVIAHSEVHPQCSALLRDVEERRDLFQGVKNKAAFVLVSATEGQIPTALGEASVLPAIAAYRVATKSGTVGLVALAEGVSRATSLRLFVDDCIERFWTAPAPRPA